MPLAGVLVRVGLGPTVGVRVLVAVGPPGVLVRVGVRVGPLGVFVRVRVAVTGGGPPVNEIQSMLLRLQAGQESNFTMIP